MSGWTDAHNHLQDQRLGDAVPVIATMKASGVTRCVVNATCQDDWSAVANLAIRDPDFILPAYGIHPWKAHTATAEGFEKLRELLRNDPRASIGECGLDRWITNPPLEVQRPVFLEQVRLAREMARPITIHCLKAWEPLFGCFAESPPPGRFLLHSFGGSIETARRLLPMGAYFSFSGYFLHARKSATLEVFRALPLDRILLESDAPDMLPPPEFITHPLPGDHHHPANLPAVGAALATALGIPAAKLADITRQNARECFAC
jgi:TatD DNase family protein